MEHLELISVLNALPSTTVRGIIMFKTLLQAVEWAQSQREKGEYVVLTYSWESYWIVPIEAVRTLTKLGFQVIA